MDAVPMTFGQEVGGWARSIELSCRPHHSDVAPSHRTAARRDRVGTGLNAPKGFADRRGRRLSARTGITFSEALDHFEAQSSQDAITEAGRC